MKYINLLLLFATTFTFANNPEPKEIQWISFEKAVKLSELNPKPLIVDIYTDWCHWCKVMDKKTYTNQEIIRYINSNFYAVKFNAEQKAPVTFRGQTFKYVPNGKRGVHEFAASILQGKLSYPSTVFLNKNKELVQAVPGYLKTPMMEKLINFMHQEAYITKDWPTFEKEFKSKL